MELEHEEEYKYKLPPLSKEASGLFTKVSCPSCKASVAASNININDKICKCVACDSIFSLDQSLEKLAKPVQKLKRPEGIDMIYFGDELDLTIDQPVSTMATILLSIGPLFAFLFTALYFKKGELGPLITALPFWMFTIFGTISVLKKGKIYITIDDRSLNIKYRPKRFSKDNSYNVRDIDQLYLKTGSEGIALMMVIDGHQGEKHEQLIGKFQSLSQAKYLEQEIERHLGIQNRKVAGEIQ